MSEQVVDDDGIDLTLRVHGDLADVPAGIRTERVRVVGEQAAEMELQVNLPLARGDRADPVVEFCV